MVAGDLCPRIDMETDHFVARSHKPTQGRSTTNFAALRSIDIAAAELTVKCFLILVCILGCFRLVACALLFLRFQTQLAIYTAVSLFRIA